MHNKDAVNYAENISMGICVVGIGMWDVNIKDAFINII